MFRQFLPVAAHYVVVMIMALSSLVGNSFGTRAPSINYNDQVIEVTYFQTPFSGIEGLQVVYPSDAVITPTTCHYFSNDETSKGEHIVTMLCSLEVGQNKISFPSSKPVRWFRASVISTRIWVAKLPNSLSIN